MNLLFEPMKIKGMDLRNRFVRSATYDGAADRNGDVTEKQIELYSDLAAGGVGLIITGITYVHPSGQISAFQNAIAGEDSIPGLRKLTKTIHDRGAKVAVQLFHAGRERAKFIHSKDQTAFAPSRLENDSYPSGTCRAMSEQEIWEIIGAFGDAARRAGEAGFDAVQIHAAHGYLLSQFLSPATNRRKDTWGGVLEHRLRFHREVLRDIRAKVGEDYPVLIKVGVQDGLPGGLPFEEGKAAAQSLAHMGYDALEISSGLRGKGYQSSEFRTGINRVQDEAYFRNWCAEIKTRVRVPVMIVGGLRSYKLMQDIIQKKEADFISLSRPLIREPGLINRWQSGDLHRATCISCNMCFDALLKGEKLYCVQEAKKA